MTSTPVVPVITNNCLDLLKDADLADPGVILLIDKPYGWTSFDVVARCRKILRTRRIGHCGTLDPMATGLLILCVGRATKRVDELQAGLKEYTGTFRLGETTASEDAETPVDLLRPVEHVTPEMIAEKARAFMGESMQIPPMYSAIKIDGQRLYKLARRGQVVERPARQIRIDAFDITGVEMPEVAFRIVCTKGTYIRSIARDFGEKLGTGAHLSSLRRTRSGDSLVETAVTLEDIRNILQPAQEQE